VKERWWEMAGLGSDCVGGVRGMVHMVIGTNTNS
jgi:hypothetical protein